MENRHVQKNILNNRGQTAVEYILLIAVIMTVGLSVFKSSYFVGFFGEDGTFVKTYTTQFEYSYRNGVGGRDKNQQQYSSPDHPSYRSQGNTRFFGALNTYPR
jgi:hypothetical protein